MKRYKALAVSVATFIYEALIIVLFVLVTSFIAVQAIMEPLKP